MDTQKEDIYNGQYAQLSKHQECYTNTVNAIYMTVAIYKFKLLFYVRITVQYICAKTAALQKPITISVVGYARRSLENNASFVSYCFLKWEATIFQINASIAKKSSCNWWEGAINQQITNENYLHKQSLKTHNRITQNFLGTWQSWSSKEKCMWLCISRTTRICLLEAIF